MAVALIARPSKPASRSEDINFTIARVALNIYEGIMEHKITIIGEIVSSGLIPALLYRVGKGVSVDKHFCKLLTRFITMLLRKVLAAKSDELRRSRTNSGASGAGSVEVTSARGAAVLSPVGENVSDEESEAKDDASLISSIRNENSMDDFACGKHGDSLDELVAGAKQEEDHGGLCVAHSASEDKLSAATPGTGTSTLMMRSNSGRMRGRGVSVISKAKPRDAGFNLRTISHTLHAQGVTDMLITSICACEDNEVVADSIQSLAMLTFDAIYHTIANNLVLMGRISLLTNNRSDCFLPGISLITQFLTYQPLSDESVELFVSEFKIVPSLIRALRPSSLMAKLNDRLFTSVARLSVHAKFYSVLKKCHGVPLMCFEVDARKKIMRKNRRARATQGGYDEDGTLQMLHVIRKDWAAIKIQNMVRQRLRATRFYQRRLEEYSVFGRK